MENKFLVIKYESRGDIEDPNLLDSNLDVKEFCEQLLLQTYKDLTKNLSQQDREDFDEYWEEWSCVSKINEYSYEVCISEEESFEVYKLQKLD